MTREQAKSVAIIGAGVAGLAAAKSLVKNGFSCKIYDRQPELGGVWANGYAGFGVQVQKDLYEFPEFPLPPEAENFTPGPAFRQYLEEYADKFEIRECLHLGMEVSSVERMSPVDLTATITPAASAMRCRWPKRFARAKSCSLPRSAAAFWKFC